MVTTLMASPRGSGEEGTEYVDEKRKSVLRGCSVWRLSVSREEEEVFQRTHLD